MIEPFSTKRSLVGFYLGVVVVLLVALFASVRYSAPAATSNSAPIMQLLEELLGDAIPRPAGSAANERFAKKAFAVFEKAGYKPELQETFICTGFGGCGRVRNVIAELVGRDPSSAILVAAHFDTVAASPGAWDDGVGVGVVLEAARTLKMQFIPESSIIFLLTDGEEVGLLGAEAFARDHPSMPRVRMLLNIDALGGLTSLHIHGEHNGWVAPHLDRAVRPYVTSVTHALDYLWHGYDDAIVFQQRGFTTFSFGGAGDGHVYHSALDRYENLDAGVIEHKLTSVIAVLRALANADLKGLELPSNRERYGDIVFFDVLTFGVVTWPSHFSPVLAVFACVLVAGVLLRLKKQALFSMGEIVRSIAGVTIVGAITFSGGALLLHLLRLAGAFPATYVAKPSLPLIAVFAIEVAIVALVRTLWRGTFWSDFSALAILVSIASLVFSVALPAVSYAFIVTAVVMGVGGGLAMRLLAKREETKWIAQLLPIAALVMLVSPLILSVYTMSGYDRTIEHTFILASIATLLAPLVSDCDRSLQPRMVLPMLALAAVTSCFAVWSGAREPLAKESTLRLHQDVTSGNSRWIVYGSLPEEMKKHARFEEEHQLFPWSSGAMRVWVATATVADASLAPAPLLEKIDERVESGKRTVRARLKSVRNAETGMVVVPPDVPLTAISIDGRNIVLQESSTKYSHGYRQYSVMTLPKEGIELELVFDASKSAEPVELIISDTSYGLPAAGKRLTRLRPPNLVPSHVGDSWMISTRTKI